MKGFIWYGMDRCPAGDMPKEACDKIQEAIEICRKDLSKKSGGFNLAPADMITIHISGNGWSVEGKSDPKMVRR